MDVCVCVQTCGDKWFGCNINIQIEMLAFHAAQIPYKFMANFEKHIVYVADNFTQWNSFHSVISKTI